QQKRLAADFPAVARYASEVAATLHNLALQRGRDGQHAEAQRLLEEAVAQQRKAHQADPRHRTYANLLRQHLASLAASLMRQGRHAEGARAAADSAIVRKGNADDAYIAASLLARCVPLPAKDAELSEARRRECAEEYGARAVALLRESMARG